MVASPHTHFMADGSWQAWPQGWIEFLRSEREGARGSTSRFGALLVTLLAGFLSAILVLRQQGAPSDLMGQVVSIYLWALASTVVVGYFWAQYLGALKSISPRYLDPRLETRNELAQPRIRQADFTEMLVRDPGYL